MLTTIIKISSKIIKLVENKTKKNKKISVQLALNYGSKHEIINSVVNDKEIFKPIL